MSCNMTGITEELLTLTIGHHMRGTLHVIELFIKVKLRQK